MSRLVFTEDITKDTVKLMEQLNIMLLEQDSISKPVKTIQQQISIISTTLSGATNVSTQNNAGAATGTEPILQFLSAANDIITWILTHDPGNTRVQIKPVHKNSGVAAGAYANPTITVDQYGHVSAAVAGSTLLGEFHIQLACAEPAVTF
jgi:hypothetical protein